MSGYCGKKVAVTAAIFFYYTQIVAYIFLLFNDAMANPVLDEAMSECKTYSWRITDVVSVMLLISF
ncbi:hypothetical protein [Paenibacillus alvei]|uniref:hypothetical protein n=1 Tax=Paenibacillus alvei TaxID=44250 RepID=UPI0018CCDB26|nr:hypothetical protein [Paenibacillus alvei]MBG9735013.1 hypothetical protein [Paenibacillus alvei]MBG9743471.1 hypothetical protein [Paenibacillus alvei]MCY9579847.1 hypothetical protein [Paenibacillus alvei]